MKNIIKFNRQDTIYKIVTTKPCGLSKVIHWYVNDQRVVRAIINSDMYEIGCAINVNANDTMWSNEPFNIQTQSGIHPSIQCYPEHCNEKLCNIFIKYTLIHDNGDWTLYPPCGTYARKFILHNKEDCPEININENLDLLLQINSISLEDTLQIIKVKNEIQ